MYELDHMLNGKGSRTHLDEMAEQVKLEKLAQEAEAQAHKSEHKPKTIESQRSVFAAAVLMLTRWA